MAGSMYRSSKYMIPSNIFYLSKREFKPSIADISGLEPPHLHFRFLIISKSRPWMMFSILFAQKKRCKPFTEIPLFRQLLISQLRRANY